MGSAMTKMCENVLIVSFFLFSRVVSYVFYYYTFPSLLLQVPVKYDSIMA